MSHPMKRQAGLTLVELMVATTLSLVLLAGVLLVFSANKTTYRLQNGMGTLQENGRYAMRQITADLQMAGFGGCLSPSLGSRVNNLVASSPPATDFLDDFADGEFFSGKESSGTTYDGKTMAAGTDSIEIRGPLNSNVHFLSGEIAATSAVVVKDAVTSSAASPYLLISDCLGADIFAPTNSLASGASSINHSSLSRPFAADSVVVELAEHTYFVADTGRDNSASKDILGLYRFDGTNAQELVDGVEDLEIEYALDTNDDGVIDAYQNASVVDADNNWGAVKAVRVSLLLNSVEDASAVVAPYIYFPAQTLPIDPPSDDFRLRQEFTSLITVRNGNL